jgi:hypothetical protein
VKHRKHGSGADAGTYQDDRIIAGGQSKSSSRRTDFQNVSGVYMIVQERTGDAIHLALVQTRQGLGDDGQMSRLVPVEDCSKDGTSIKRSLFCAFAGI